MRQGDGGGQGLQGVYCLAAVRRDGLRPARKSERAEEPRKLAVEFDKIIEFTGKQTKKKCPHSLRIIRSTDEKTGNAITILTNIFNITAEYIAKMYRARWNIEIFFKTIKQNLRIKKFYGQV